MPIPPRLQPLLLDRARQQEGPFYLYDRDIIRETCRRFRSIPYAPLSIHFATMANAHPDFLGVVREEGLSLFVNSVGHLEAAFSVGFTPSGAIFTASGMSEDAMRRVHDLGVHVNLDSLGQVAQWRRLFPGVPFGIRCNVGAASAAQAARKGAFLGRRSRLGLTPTEIRRLAGSPDMAGLHLYAGTDILDLDYFEASYRRLGVLAPLFPALSYMDLGGGFGVPGFQESPFDHVGYGEMVARFMAGVSAACGRPLRLILEPGRIIGAEAGVFCCRVTDVKRRGRTQFVGVNASSAQFPRPLLYPDTARHPAILFRNGGRVGDEPRDTSIFGCSTYSRDFLARDVLLPTALPGDLVCLGHAGSYCAAMYTRFLGFDPAPEFFA